jgi:CheY-like chemotaxis protein
LIVDDSAVDRTLAGGILQKLPNWRVTFANHGVEALAVLQRTPVDLVLTDMLMPEMDGLELVQEIRAKYPLIPVILITAHGSEDIAIKALQKGAASYVPKKLLARDLGETVENVIAVAQAGRNQRRIVESINHLETSFVLENDAALIPPLVANIEEQVTRLKLCEPSGMILLGVALHEAMTNAILHGNLELSSDLKEKDEKEFYRLADERRAQDPYQKRRISVRSVLTRSEATFVIRDEGNGFDPALLPDPTDPENLSRVFGRGLLLINTFMDRVEHNAKGNEITMVKYRS